MGFHRCRCNLGVAVRDRLRNQLVLLGDVDKLLGAEVGLEPDNRDRLPKAPAHPSEDAVGGGLRDQAVERLIGREYAAHIRDVLRKQAHLRGERSQSPAVLIGRASRHPRGGLRLDQ